MKAVVSSFFAATLIAAYATPTVTTATFAFKTVPKTVHSVKTTRPRVERKSTPTMTSDGFLRVGTKVPNFDMQILNRKGKTSLKQLLGKKPLIINAWASWCPPCQLEAPLLEKASKQYSKRVTFIGVNLTRIDSVSGARKFVKKYHISYPVLLDKTGQFWQSYTVISYPTTFVVSKTGRLLFAYQGSLTARQIQELVKVAEK